MLCAVPVKIIFARAVLLVSLALLVAAIPVAGMAAEQDKKYADRTTRKTPAMRLKVGNALGEAQKFAEEEKWTEANKVLEDELGSRLDKLNSYEVAQYYNFKGYLAYSQENYKGALAAYNSVLKQENLPPALEDQVIYTLGQLHFIIEDYQACVDYMKRWLDLQAEPGESALVITGQCLYAHAEKQGTRENYREAIDYIARAIELRQGKGSLPEENWYLLLRAMYYGLGDYENAARIQEILLEHWPKKDYWVQLAGLYGEISANEILPASKRVKLERRQLAIYQEAYDRGFLTRESEILDLARLLLYHEIPYRSGKILARGLKTDNVRETKANLELESQAWYSSHNIKRSLSPLSRAAELADDGSLYVVLAKTYLRLNDPEHAVGSLLKALEKNRLPSEGDTLFTLGVAYYNLEQTGKARDAFLRASEFEEIRKAGLQWARFMEREEKRLATRLEYLGY